MAENCVLKFDNQNSGFLSRIRYTLFPPYWKASFNFSMNENESVGYKFVWEYNSLKQICWIIFEHFLYIYQKHRLG